MIIPTRCFSCGAVIADRWEEFEERAKDGSDDAKAVLDDLGLERYCCRTAFLTHVDILDDVAAFKKE